MLVDPLVLCHPADSEMTNVWTNLNGASAGTVDLTFHTTDVGPGASTRVCQIGDVKYTLSIKHSQTNENKPLVTDRTLVRLDRTSPDTTTGQLVTASAYLVAANPLGSAASSVADTLALVRALAIFILMGESAGDSFMTNANKRTFERTLAGEP